MVWQYTQNDVVLAESVLLSLQNGFPGTDGLYSDGRIEFQFPPKITNDSRKGGWNEVEIIADEPVAAMTSNSGREITMQWTYVVDSFDVAPSPPGAILPFIFTPISNGWTVGRITKNIRTLRGYFTLGQITEGYDALVVKFKMWGLGHETDPISCRINSVDVKYSDTVVLPPSGTHEAFYLRTDVTIDMNIWTQGESKEGEDSKIHDVPGLSPKIPQEWY